MTAKTITTHNGCTSHRAHNIRDQKATGRQKHIDKSLSHMNEMLVDEEPRDAYKRIFGVALDEYNAKQTRPERRIKDYYDHICADEKKHPVYEMIVQVGDRYDTGIDAPTERAIIKEFIADWPVRNPNLELIGAYIHADETDGTLHAHIDYIPVARGYKRSLSVQNGLVSALGQQGFEMEKHGSETAQIRWERRENQALEEICNAHGIEAVHPLKGEKHLSTPEYIAKQQALGEISSDIVKADAELVETRLEALRATTMLQGLEGQVKAHETQIDVLQGEIGALARYKRELEIESSAVLQKRDALRHQANLVKTYNDNVAKKYGYAPIAELERLTSENAEIKAENGTLGKLLKDVVGKIKTYDPKLYNELIEPISKQLQHQDKPKTRQSSHPNRER